MQIQHFETAIYPQYTVASSWYTTYDKTCQQTKEEMYAH